MKNTISTPILVVGCGPAGILASLLLSQLRIEHVVIEQRDTLHQLPQAHVLKLRTLEILRGLGLDQAVLESATPTEFMKYVTWRDTLAGFEFGKISMIGRKGTSDRYKTLSPTFPANLPQDEYEKILFDGAKMSKYADFRFGTTCLNFSWHDNGIVAGIGSEFHSDERINAQFVLAADGASSSIRRELGFDFIGDASLQKFITMVVHADLRDIVEDYPGILHWVNSPACTGTFIIHNVESRFVFMIPYDESLTDPADFSEEICLDILRKAIGRDIPLEIIGIDKWNMSAQVAEHFSSKNVFLVGDAAHRFPPTGGMGLNTGAQDVYNLVWKIGQVLKGNASPTLLDTYESECKPVAEINCSHSKSNYLKMAEVDSVLFGDDKWLTPDRLAFLNGTSSTARVEREKIRAAIENQLEHFDTIVLDLGYRYKSIAIVEDTFEAPSAHSGVHEFVPFCRSGYRFPHMRLKRDGTQLSSLDLLDYEYFSLFCNSKKYWEKEFALLPETTQNLIQLIEIGPNSDIEDSEGDWERMSEIGSNGAILVRPDGHVAWRFSEEGEQSFKSLSAVMKTILGWPNS